MNGLKKCKQCGEVKSETLFREYYGRGANKGQRTGGRFKTCKDCESMNSRYKYLNKKESRTDVEQAELDTYEKMYKMQRSLGLRPPATQAPKDKPVVSMAEQLLAKYANMEPVTTAVSNETVPVETPGELQTWLTRDLTGQDPDDLQDEFDKVETKYRPQTGLDTNLAPVYDNTYKGILDKIQDRLDEHEDEFYD